MDSEEQTRRFIERHPVTISNSPVDANPGMPDFIGDHWKVTLRIDGRRMTTYFSKGDGHRGAEPTLEEVLHCLASDADGVEQADGFEDWAIGYGYDTDSRGDERIYNRCVAAAARLWKFLGDDRYQELLYGAEDVTNTD